MHSRNRALQFVCHAHVVFCENPGQRVVVAQRAVLAAGEA